MRRNLGGTGPSIGSGGRSGCGPAGGDRGVADALAGEAGVGIGYRADLSASVVSWS